MKVVEKSYYGSAYIIDFVYHVLLHKHYSKTQAHNDMKTTRGKKILGGRYKIVREIARGGFGITFLAEDTHASNSPCVIKKLDPQNADIETAKILFKREASVLFHLQQNQQIPKYFDYFEEDQSYYLVQEYIEGKSLQNLLEKRWPRDKVVIFLREILEILRYLHQINIIHRDVKPSNIMLRKADRKFVLIDFGAVKYLDPRYLSPHQQVYTTQTMIGTRGYAPEEQLAGRPGYNSDIYGLGMTAIQLLTGIHPRNLRRDAQDKIIWSDEVNVDNLLASILTKMVYSNPDERYQYVDEIVRDLNEITIVDGLINYNDFTSDTEIESQQISELTARPYEPGNFFKLWYLLIVLGAAGIILVVTEFFINPFIRPLVFSNRGNHFLRLHQPEKALNEFQNIINIQQNYAEAWKGRGDALLDLGRFPGALGSYNKALAIEPDNFKALNNKGKVLSKLNRYPEALEAHEKVLKENENDVDAWSGKGIAYIGLGKKKEASEAFEKVKLIRPDIPYTWQEIGLATESLEGSKAAKPYFEEALGAFQAFLNQHPQDPIAWTDQGYTLQKLNRFPEALASYEKALEIDKNFYEALIGKGNMLDQTGKPEEALSAFNAASQIRPDDYLAWYSRGILLAVRFKKYKEALESLDKAIARRNDFYFAWLYKGISLSELKRYNEALAALDKAKELEPKNPYAWANRAEVLKNLGRKAEAQESYNKAAEFGFPRDQIPKI